MKQSITIVLATVIAAFSQGQEEPAPDARELIFVEPTAQELEPVENVFTYHTPDYPYRIRKILFDRAHRENEFQFLIKPSFRPETLLTVRKKGDEFIAQVLIPEEQIWHYTGDDAELKVIEKVKTFPKDLADPASRLWQTMLLRTRFKWRRPVTDSTSYMLIRAVLDGTSYVFVGSDPRRRIIMAKSDNPARGTKPYLLARIGEHLIEFVEANRENESQILKDTQELISLLERALMEEEASNSTSDGIR